MSLRKVGKSYAAHEVIHGLDLEVADQEFVALVGPSGCGKSTLLRMIAGLEDITGGEIAIGERVVNEVDPKDRYVAMVFQDYALYPHLTVFQNIAFSLRYRGVAKAEVARRVAHAAAILDIEALLARKPRELSGGQRQRVAMGRAIVREPKVFLFDEPLSNLDAKQPVSVFVAEFIDASAMNFVPGHVRRSAAACAVELSQGARLDLPASRLHVAADTPVIVGLRPEHLHWSHGDAGALAGIARVVEPLGSDTLVIFDAAGRELQARLPPRLVRRAVYKATRPL